MVKKSSPNKPANRFSPVNSAVPLVPFNEIAQVQGPVFWEWLAAFFAKLPQGIILTGRDGRVLIFNETACYFLGYKPAEVVDRLFLWDLCKPSSRGQPPHFRTGLEQGNGFQEEEVELVSRGEGK